MAPAPAPPPPPMAERRTRSDDDHDLTSTVLPVEILHRILFFLPTADAVRISTLSRTWLHAWNSFPVLTFNFTCHTQQLEETFPLVIEFSKTISILHEEEAMSVNFHVSWPSFRSDFFANCIDEWMCLISRNRVREIEIDLLPEILEEKKDATDTYYLAHETLFAASESLYVLKLRGCRMMLQSLWFEKRELVSLRVLYLEDYLIDYCVMKSLLALCPFLEKCTLISVSKRVSNIWLFDHRTLKDVKLEGFKEVMITGMSNLQVLDVSNFRCIEWVNICNKLRILSLKTCRETSYANLQAFICALPLLKSLILNTKNKRPITISNQIVENISVSSCKEPQRIRVHAPWLQSFEYRGSSLPEISFVIHPSALQRIDLILTLQRDEAFSYFNSLRRNLPKLAVYNPALKLTINAKEFSPDELPLNEGPLPAFVESVELQDIPSPLSLSIPSLIKWLFWSSRPLSLSTHPSYIFLKVFQEMMDDNAELLRGVKVETRCGIKDFKNIKIDENCDLLSEETLKFQLEWF